MKMVPPKGFEPLTHRLRSDSSTSELQRLCKPNRATPALVPKVGFEPTHFSLTKRGPYRLGHFGIYREFREFIVGR